MKAMIWKEWRENLRWALLAAVGLGIAAAYFAVANSPSF